VIFVICTVVILILYQVFVMQPQNKAREAAMAAERPASKPNAAGAIGPQTTPTSAVFVTNRTQALGGAARVPISTPTPARLAVAAGRPHRRPVPDQVPHHHQAGLRP
jgi:YidC/Oxa1 family membrane protein insertase